MRSRWAMLAAIFWATCLFLLVSSNSFGRTRQKQAPITPSRKHWLDYATAAVVAGGFIASAWSAFNGTWQLQLSDRTAERQLRAYMMPTGLLVENFGTSLPLVGKLEAKNAGATPALHVHGWLYITVQPSSGYEFPNRDAHKPASDYAPGAILQLGPERVRRALTAQEQQEVVDGLASIFLYGQITYEDVFKHPRYVNFRYVAYVPRGPVPKPGTPLSVVAAEGGNDSN